MELWNEYLTNLLDSNTELLRLSKVAKQGQVPPDALRTVLCKVWGWCCSYKKSEPVWCEIVFQSNDTPESYTKRLQLYIIGVKLRENCLCASGALTRFYATVQSSVILCITIQRNIMQTLNCACAYYDTAEHNILLILLLLRTALAPYWQSLVYLNCACVYYNTLLLHKIEKIKIKMAGKLVNAPKSHKTEYAPMHTIRVITRLA